MQVKTAPNGEATLRKAIQSPIAINAVEDSTLARMNPRVDHCCEAWERAFQATSAQGKTLYSCRADASVAYRKAMPPLSSYQSACDFVACVVHGLLIEAITETQGGKLLYAAQIVLSTGRQQPKTK